MKNNSEQTFESAFESLKALKQIIDDPNTPLDALVDAYEEASKHYKVCVESLNNAKQRVTIVKEKIEKSI